MTTFPRRGAFAALVLLFSFSLSGQSPWDAPPFTADPKTLLAAAQRVESGDYSVVLLLDEAEYTIDDDGGMVARDRMMMYVVTEAGVESTGEVRAPWLPWHGDRPSIAARVIAKDGTVHMLDASAVVEVPAGEETDIFSDGRVLRAPLPAVAVGSVIEYVITRSSRVPIAGAGATSRFIFGGYSPIERSRAIIDAPSSRDPRIVDKSGITARVEEKNGRRRRIYETGRIEGRREFEYDLPYDTIDHPYLAFSTGKSWQEIATSYAAIVDKQIAGSDLEKLVRAAIGKSTDRREVVAKLLAAIQKDIRYAGIEIGEGSIVPRTPRQVLANKYGDCKDKAVLLVAMLRVAGFPAHVVLLNAGSDFDSHADLPALGHFNHAIAVVEGDPAIWVDPTDVFARAGELPVLDQGRMALIARPETTTLVKTPEVESAAHVYREKRTFYLPEDGKARVVEESLPAGTTEAALRRWVTGFDAKNLQENLEAYAKSAYVAKKLARFETTDPQDLSKPFRMTLEVPESQSGVVNQGEASVVVNIGVLPHYIPESLRNWRELQPGENPDDLPKKRRLDFLFPQPGVREWEYRIVPPAGYVARTLPQNETKKIGTTTFSQELREEADHTVVATFRFDTGKRRITAAEFEETRVALTKFVTDSSVTMNFELVGQSKLNAGDVRGALDEFRRLTVLHPKEAQHHIEIARALLTGGLGDAAREEARRAVAIEPKSARAHQMLGFVLLHDSLGRLYRKGFDHDGAIAALRKAKELAPDDYAIRLTLSTALSYGTDGLRFSRGARLAEAAEEIQAMGRDLGDQGKRMLPELTVIYSHMGRFADVRALAPTFEDAQQRDLARIIATAAIDGTDAAMRELDAFDQQRKRSYASGVAQTMMHVRLYPQAAALMEASSQGTAAAADQRPLIEILKKLKRVEEMPQDDGPRGVVAKLWSKLLHNDLAGLTELLPAEYVTGKNNPLTQMGSLDLRPPDEIPLLVFGDLLSSMLEVRQDGDDATGYRLRVRILGAPTAHDVMSIFVRREDGRWLIRGASNGGDELTGSTVLSMVEKGELEAARTWLNWAREDAKGGTSDDPLEGSPFAALWSKSKATATAEELRLAAASIATDEFFSKTSEPILIAARDGATSEAAKSAIDLALIAIYEDRKDWAKALLVTSRLLAANGDSPTAFSKHVSALLRNGKAADATALANQRLERLPNDPDAVRALALAAAEAGDYASAQQHAVRLADELRPAPTDFALAAWMALFTDQRLDRAIEHVQHASKNNKEEKQEEDVQSLRTLAALYAATGKSIEARTALLKAIEGDHRGKLESKDWYVLGRIAENYGVHEYAIAAYRKVEKEPGTASVSELAQRRLAGLVKKKTP